MNKQYTLFDLPPASKRVNALRRLRRPIWTENKAKLIERYLYYFVLITKHGAYIDGFAGPQEPDTPEMWAANLVLHTEPPWLRNFYLFDHDRQQYDRLNKLRQSADLIRVPKRTIAVYHDDFNLGVGRILAPDTIGESEACFCLLDQRTFECHWSTLTKLAAYKTRMKIELFYFFAEGWMNRALAAQRDTQVLTSWWGNKDWEDLPSMPKLTRAEFVARRFQEELGYQSAIPWPIFDRADGGRVMYYMIHATDHDAAPNLMHRAYHKAVLPKESLEQLELEFMTWKDVRS